MTYRLDRNQFIENGAAVTADKAIARVRRIALYAALYRRQLAAEPVDLKQAA